MGEICIRRSSDGLSREVPAARLWSALLAAVPVLIIIVLAQDTELRPHLVLVSGLVLFGVVFAVNLSVHSYFIPAYAGSERQLKMWASITRRMPPGVSAGHSFRGCFISGAASPQDWQAPP